MSERIDDGGPAYPHHVVNGGEEDAAMPDGQILPAGETMFFHGMSLRDHFAGLAMQALLGSLGPYEEDASTGDDGENRRRENVAFDVDKIAVYAYAQAEAMLAERARRQA